MSNFLKPGTVFPSEDAQKRYPLDVYPCGYCSHADFGLPYLTDNPSELYWHHVHPVSKSRAGCSRFNTGRSLGEHPREGTAIATYNLRALLREELKK